MSGQQDRIVFRSTFGIVLTVVTWAICGAGIASAVASGAGVTPVVLLATLGWVVWLAYWRPCVVTTSEGVVLQNLVRDVEIPYDAVEDVDTRFSLRIRAGGRTHAAWGAPAPSGLSGLRDGMRRGARPERWRDAPRSVRDAGRARIGDAVETASGAPATVIRRELERRAREGGAARREAQVVVRLRTPLAAVTAALVAASAFALVIGA